MRVLVLLATLGVAMARPDGGFGGGGGLQLDSYAAPISSGGGGGGGYSRGPAPQYGPPQQAPVVHKHVYVHVPPPEPTYYAPKKTYSAPPPQKHYKIVFIKAPTPPPPTVPDIQIAQPPEQKTLIYVLVKKPEDAPELNIPTPAPTQPSKPEVYFIRYKTQEEVYTRVASRTIVQAVLEGQGQADLVVATTPMAEAVLVETTASMEADSILTFPTPMPPANQLALISKHHLGDSQPVIQLQMHLDQISKVDRGEPH